MAAYARFYGESLYPLQDGILSIVKRTGAPFYLTGGTAVSRHYSPIRYSDDLDLFVNRDPAFSRWVERLYAELEVESRQGSFSILADRVVRYEDYVQLFVQGPSHDNGEVVLKIDLVNDVAPRYGEIEWNPTLGRVDSWRNILSNKVSALYRMEAKDVVDLWTLAKRKPFNWAEIVQEAATKEAGLDPVVLYDLLKSFPEKELLSIKWIHPRPEEDLLLGDLGVLARDLFEGEDNRLCG